MAPWTRVVRRGVEREAMKAAREWSQAIRLGVGRMARRTVVEGEGMGWAAKEAVRRVQSRVAREWMSGARRGWVVSGGWVGIGLGRGLGEADAAAAAGSLHSMDRWRASRGAQPRLA